MKRVLLLILGLAAANVGGNLQAQQPPPQPVAARSSAPPKIGVLNLLEVYEKCERYKKLKADMEAEVAPFKKEKEDIEKVMEQWNKALRNKDVKPEVRDQGFKVLTEARRRLEDLNYRLNTEVAKHLEEKMKGMVTYVNGTIEAYAKQGNYDLVIAFNEAPDVKTAMNNITAMDKGMIRPLIFPGMPRGIDISQDVLLWLNR